MIEAGYYLKLPGNRVKCELCPNYCVLSENMRGVCKGRLNQGGKLYAENYGMVVTGSVDPIEKKPLYHYFPSERILSISTYGCNFACDFCQNSEISQHILKASYIAPKEIIVTAKQKHSFGIAYTYAEPMVWYDYLIDLAKTARENNIKNVLVTNGYINEGPLKSLLPFIDAVNLDIKSMNNQFYKKYCKGSLAQVLETAKAIHGNNIHLEITNLIIPGLNDSISDIKNLIMFIKEELCHDVPLHLSRYFPHYKMMHEPTPSGVLLMAYEMAKEFLDFVYIGNIHTGQEFTNAYCPSCNNLLIERNYFSVGKIDITDGKCNKCEYEINVIQK